MRCALLVLLVLLPRIAGADVAVVMHGASPQQDQIKGEIVRWLKTHGHEVVEGGLPAAATDTLSDCFTVSDLTCARRVVENQATTATVVAVRVDDSSSRQVQLFGAWIAKGRAVVSVQRVCDACTPAKLPDAVDDLLRDLARSGGAARIRVTSTPEGLQVLLDNRVIGTTPIEREVAAGTHTIRLTKDGRTVGRSRVSLEPAQELEVDIPVTALREPRDEPAPPTVTSSSSSAWPLALTLVGGVAVAGGVTLYLVSQEETGRKPTYIDTKPIGVGIAAAGFVVAGIGAVLWAAGSDPPTSQPAVAITREGVYAGWTGRF